jgi:predicted small integral membrane protein
MNQFYLQAQFLTKGSLAFSVGLFALLTGIGNMVDFETNWKFVQHVLAMDDFEPWFDGKNLSSRAVKNPQWQLAFYYMVIAGELLCGALSTAGGLWIAVMGWRGRSVLPGKLLFTLSALVAVLVWYTGFAVIGSEYFAMWASKWNGQLKAYAFVTFILMSLIYVSLPEHVENR